MRSADLTVPLRKGLRRLDSGARTRLLRLRRWYKKKIPYTLRFFKVSYVLLVIAVGTSVFDRVLQSYPSGRLSTPDEFPTANWILSLVVALVFLAVLFWVISKVDREVWRAISRVFGWEEDRKP